MRTLKAVAATLIAFTLLVAAQASPASAGSASDEAAFAQRINDLRRSKGLAPMVVDTHLSDVARSWTSVMIRNGDISHNPNLAGSVRHDWRKLGENVGRGTNVQILHDTFVASPGHYRNLVDPDFTHMGIAVLYDAKGQLFTTHVFMKGAAAVCKAMTDSLDRLYQAYFLRTPDPDGFSYWLSQYVGGQSLVTISDTFTRSAEYTSAYSGLSNRSFVDMVYRNVMQRTPDAAGLSYWTSVLDQGQLPRGGVMIRFSESAEFVSRTGTTPPAPC